MKTLSKINLFLTICVLILSSFISKAQNYRALKTDAEYLFLDSTSYNIIAIRIDSTKIIGSDTFYYNFKQLQPSDDGCYILDGASWLGNQVIEKSDGMFVFSGYPFSPVDSVDTYRILTQTQVNHPWYFYSYHTINHHIEASVTEIKMMQFLGLTDSVKVISLTRKNAAGQLIADPVNTQKILLSKNYGLIRLPKFDDLLYSNKFYDLAGKTNPETGITNLKTLQIYDFEPGDELHTVYYNRYFSIPYPETTISTIMKVLSKTVGSSGNEVSYEFERCQSDSYKLSDTSATVTYHFDTISHTYSTMLTPEFETEPLEPTITISNSWVINTIMGLSTDPLFPFQDIPYKAINSLEAYSFSSGNCYMPVMIDGCLTLLYYFKGLGGPYYECTEISWGPSSNLLVYYKKGSETWGTPLSCDSLLHVGIAEAPEIQNVKIYPNPTTATITVSIPANVQIPCKLDIFDNSGRFLRGFTISQQTQSFDLSYIPAGLYNYKVTSSKGNIFRGKIIRQ